MERIAVAFALVVALSVLCAQSLKDQPPPKRGAIAIVIFDPAPETDAPWLR